MPAYQLGASALVQCDIVLPQGADQDYIFRYGTTDLTGTFAGTDLTGWTARSQMRTKTGDATAWLTASTGVAASGEAVITLGDDGTVVLHIPYQATEGGAWNTRSTGVWDLELISPDGTRRIRLVEGAVTVDHDVTRDSDGS